ncbi:MAG: T9SS type A sorting domain-containing protein [candidate division Zixibacteria bacterium]|nr:T9SS type A sorting domain-containing protein [candidate division Zixibacteria bacterium]
MRKLTLTMFLCLAFIMMSATAWSGEGIPVDKKQMLGDILQSVSFEKQSLEVPSMTGGNGTGCVDVDIELPDSIMVENFFEPVFAEGYFEVINCGDETGQVELSLSAAINIAGFIDTTIYLPGFPIVLGAGETLFQDLVFPVPPFAGSYTFCIYAVTGDVADTACATMIVTVGDMPGFPIDVCGILMQGENCVLFAPACNERDIFVLSDYGEFQVGDTVRVVGEMDMDCQTECVGAMGCITTETIESCGGWMPDIPFEDCGVLVQGTDCVLFSPFIQQHYPADSTGFESLLVVLDEYGTFVVGDTVFVSGQFHPNCETTCSDAMGCIKDNDIETCEGEDPEYPFGAIGILIQGTDCVVFVPKGHDGAFVLDNYGNAVVGDTVFVGGILDINCDTECSDVDGCITDNIIEIVNNPGGGNDWDIPFFAFGVIIQGENCVLFEEGMTGDRLLLDNYGTFIVGDSVCVEGTLELDCESDCIDIIGCVEVNEIIDCSNNQPDSTYYQGRGVLTQATDCVLFCEAQTGALLYLDDLGNFGDGDTVCVDGILDMSCETSCSDAQGCITVNLIVSCGSNPQDYIELPGVLVQVENCLLFAPGGMNTNGFVLDNYGDFVEGDEVYVTGMVDLDCQTDCVGAFGCINDNTIEALNPPAVNMVDLNAHNYPNPFNPATTISFDLPSAMTVTVSVHNILGQTVSTLIDGETRQGRQNIRWDGNDSYNQKVASGIYFYRIITDDKVVTKKMVLTK